MNHGYSGRLLPLTLLLVTLLLTGCTGLTPRLQTVPSSAVLQGYCERPQLPDIFDAETSTWHWLAFSQTTPLLDWVALPSHPTESDLALAWALYFSQPDQSPVILQLGNGQLQRLRPDLPNALHPLVDLHLNASRVLLLDHQRQARQRLDLEGRIQTLQQELAQKQAQIDALTAIESQLNTRDTGPEQEDTP
ncbi:hypothetical protein [Saccharospirillum impatiens]|uniref:hypothetical protein n=1 Tax=Saccharospirillum impatiens TaxID=169438 RepID=UPI00048E5B04|nr:hypothetical protein [Saccharospirillum impatiens]